MTANLTFQIEKRDGVLTLPNAALRFHPRLDQVRKGDQPIIEGREEDELTNANSGPGEAKDAAGRALKPNYVWIIEGSQLAAVEVTTGLADKGRTEILSGNLSDGQEVVTGLQAATVKK
jgi:HlyD family secretion protein